MACGYLEVNQDWNDSRKVCMELVNAEIGLFTIFNFITNKPVSVDSGIKQARKEFNRQCKLAGTKRTINK